MDWRKLLREIALAGGAVVVSSCTGIFNVPCGNASSDPCICDRPKMDPMWKQECDVKMACEGDGGIYQGGTTCQGSKPDAAHVTDAGAADANDGGGKDAP
jgi:hypothetical protein